MSGAVSASGRFVFQLICLPIHLSPSSCVRGCVRLRGICLPIHLSPRSSVRGCVSLQGVCLRIHLSPNSFVSQVLCQGLCPPPDDLSPNSFVSQFICLPGPCLPIHLSPRSCGRGCVRLGGFVSQFVCLPPSPKQLALGVLNSILRCVRLVSGAVSASLGSVSPIICLPSFVSHPLSPMSCVRGCVRVPGLCVSHQSPNSLLSVFSILFQAVSGYVQMVVSGSPDVPNSFVPLWQFICLPIWLVVSSSLAVSNSFVCPHLNSFVSQSGWWCPALWLSPPHLSALISTHLFPSLAGGVRLFGCL